MKSLLIGAAAAFALAGAVAAQPAYDSSQGAAPNDYPRCTQPGQDRCMATGGRHMAGKHMMKGRMHHAKKGGSTKSSKDGERG